MFVLQSFEFEYRQHLHVYHEYTDLKQCIYFIHKLFFFKFFLV